ncbi:uncharacterized protein LOC131943508 [Physella acuta]|uniref:uncharacterized protein LOC131943508 n=1 Tax=Physella acuta TaxID=109671 RepID=UPI0027DB122D|nr:uncharacterized protein LOC131943508 [Physella acuta]
MAVYTGKTWGQWDNNRTKSLVCRFLRAVFTQQQLLKWENDVTKNGKFTVSALPAKGRVTSRLHPTLSLYINRFQTPDGAIITINGATIIHADIVTENGILHIVDRMVAPVGSHMTIAEYVEKPQLRELSFSAIIMAAIVVPSLTQKTNSTKSLYTSFSPNDSYLYPMPEYGKEPLFNNFTILREVRNNFTILREVYQAHIIEDEALFLPAGLKGLPARKALYGTIRFYTRDGKLYISNNRVHAKVIQPNIPTVNGVIHVIDNLLHYIYHNALQVADSITDAKIFAQLLKGVSAQMKERLANTTVTIFIPSDWAFSKVPLYWQGELVRVENMIDRSPLEQFLYRHVMTDVAMDAGKLTDGKRLTMASNQTLTVLHKDGDIYLETSDRRVRSRIEVLDIGVTNGVVHLISNILSAEGFTIWQAVSDIPQLKRFVEVVTKNFIDMRSILSLASEKPITVFLPGNEVFDRAADYVNSLLLLDPHILFKAFQGHIISGQFSSTRVDGDAVHMTYAGLPVRLSKNERTSTIKITGGHVTSEVKVRDIFCSNGVLHIIDDILHTPTRTVDKEMRTREPLRYMQALFEKVADRQYDLNSKGSNYTVFVPNNDAFGSLPWDTVNKLLHWDSWTKQILRAHIVKNEMRTLSDIPSGTALRAEHNVIHVVKKEDHGPVYVVNNNMMAQVLVSDIPAVNGWIHIVDRILTVPYVTVADVMGSREDVSIFHHIMSPLPEYKQLITSPLRNVTLFVPSSRYIRTLTPDQLTRIKSNTDVLRKIFHGHVLPNVRLDDVFLRQYPDADYCSRSSYNVTFKISKGDNGMFVDVGYDMQPLDLVTRATGCSDGIIYVIDGFLNYSPFTVLERLTREPVLSGSFDLMTHLAPANEIDSLNDPNLSFTFLMPDDVAQDYYLKSELLKLRHLPPEERHRVFKRHVINGTVLYQDDFKNGSIRHGLLPPNVTLVFTADAVYVKFKKIESQIKQWNLIASNGVIHILMQFLYDANGSGAPRTTTPTTYVTINSMVARLENTAAVTSWSRALVVTHLVLALVLVAR